MENGFLTKNNQKTKRLMNKDELAQFIKACPDYLSENYEAFSKVRSELYNQHGEGKYALVVDKEIKGVYPTFREALVEGYKITDTFNVQRITKEPEIVTISTPFIT